ncbi:MAG: DNA polymerase, partial [Actinomycetota bacterium]|nr:DNA polymerase [Actinomycetota bacterium]
MRKHPLAECESCPLQGEKYVPSVGPENAKLAFVGEAPGSTEVRKQEPFVGPSGELLNRVLAYHGITRSDVRLTNAASCRPRGNDDLPPEALACCRPRLEAEISSAERVIALGRVATEAVLGRKVKILKERVGPPKDNVIPTLHPAYVLRQPNSLPELVSDIGKIRYNGTRFYEPKYAVLDNYDDGRRALRDLHRRYNGRPVVIDVENGVDKDEEFTHAKRLLCLGIAYAPTAAIVLAEPVLRDPRIKQQLSAVLQSCKLITQNGKHDLQILRAVGIEPGPLYFDTMLASYCLDERKGIHGLDYLAKERLGAPDWKADFKALLGRGKVDYSKAPADALHRYNAYDVAATYALYEQFDKQLGGLRGLHDFLVRSSMALIHCEEAGLLVDQHRLSDLQGHYASEIQRLESDLSAFVENPRSPKQVMEAFKQLAIKAPNTDKETLAHIAKVGGPTQRQFAELMLEYRKLDKFYGTYIQGIWNRLEQGRVHPTYLLHGTTTGRL